MALVGRPVDLAEDAARRDADVWSRWQDEIGSLLTRADSPEAARVALYTWSERASDDPDVAAAMYRAALQADMAGQLFVRAVEVPESSVHLRALDATPRPSFLRMPFIEALESFRARALITPEEFRQLSDESRTRAFTVTRISSEALRERIFRLLEADMASGGTYRDFARDISSGDVLGLSGEDRSYVENVYRTNIASAYGAGRYRQITSEAVRAARPYVEYRSAGDGRVRASHRALDGLVFAQDDPAWLPFAPPNGFQCRCSVVALRDTRGKQVTDAATLTVRPDPGFDTPPSVSFVEPV